MTSPRGVAQHGRAVAQCLVQVRVAGLLGPGLQHRAGAAAEAARPRTAGGSTWRTQAWTSACMCTVRTRAGQVDGDQADLGQAGQHRPDRGLGSGRPVGAVAADVLPRGGAVSTAAGTPPGSSMASMASSGRASAVGSSWSVRSSANDQVTATVAACRDPGRCPSPAWRLAELGLVLAAVDPGVGDQRGGLGQGDRQAAQRLGQVQRPVALGGVLEQPGGQEPQRLAAAERADWTSLTCSPGGAIEAGGSRVVSTVRPIAPRGHSPVRSPASARSSSTTSQDRVLSAQPAQEPVRDLLLVLALPVAAGRRRQPRRLGGPLACAAPVPGAAPFTPAPFTPAPLISGPRPLRALTAMPGATGGGPPGAVPSGRRPRRTRPGWPPGWRR